MYGLIDDPEVELKLALRRLAEAKSAVEAAQAEHARWQEVVVGLMDRLQRKTYTHDGFRHTLVRGETPSFDADGLKKALGATVFNKLTTAKLDGKKLEQAVTDGVVDPITVAQYTRYKERAPFIRISPANEDKP